MAIKKSFEFDESAHLNPPNKRTDRFVFAGITTALAGVAFVGIQDAHFNERPEPRGEVAMSVEPGMSKNQIFAKALDQIKETTDKTPSHPCVVDGLEMLNPANIWVTTDEFVPVIAPEVTEIIRPETC